MQVASAIKDMKQEITAENAVSDACFSLAFVMLSMVGAELGFVDLMQMSFSKGKTKVAGIGAGSAKKMKEFMETGTIEKLEEKRLALKDM